MIIANLVLRASLTIYGIISYPKCARGIIFVKNFHRRARGLTNKKTNGFLWPNLIRLLEHMPKLNWGMVSHSTAVASYKYNSH